MQLFPQCSIGVTLRWTLTRPQAAPVESEPEMRLKLFETKAHTCFPCFPGRRKQRRIMPPAPRPELASSTSFALGLIPDHDDPTQHLWKTYGSTWRVGLRRDHGAGWCGAASISSVAEACLQIGKLADQPAEPVVPTQPPHPSSHDTLRLHLRHILIHAYLF